MLLKVSLVFRNALTNQEEVNGNYTIQNSFYASIIILIYFKSSLLFLDVNYH